MNGELASYVAKNIRTLKNNQIQNDLRRQRTINMARQDDLTSVHREIEKRRSEQADLTQRLEAVRVETDCCKADVEKGRALCRQVQEANYRKQQEVDAMAG